MKNEFYAQNLIKIQNWKFN